MLTLQVVTCQGPTATCMLACVLAHLPACSIWMMGQAWHSSGIASRPLGSSKSMTVPGHEDLQTLTT